MEAIVLAGGFGTRLSHVVSDVPKPMAPVCGRPFLRFILDDLQKKGVETVVLAVGYKREVIQNFFGESYRGMKLLYSVEDTPLYTGGAIKKALTMCREKQVFIVNGDTYFDVDLRDMAKSDARLVVAIKKLRKFDRYGTVFISKGGYINGFREKQPCIEGYINGGIYYVDRSLLEEQVATVFSFEKEILEKVYREIPVAAYPSEGYFIDIGIPEDYYKAQTVFKNLCKKNKAAFFDRDGTINVDVHYLHRPDELDFIDGMPQFIRKWNDWGYRVIVVTNQAGIARGYYTEEEMRNLHCYMNAQLKQYGAHIDAFYFCPHHPDFSGPCHCRKPESGMIERAIAEFDLDPEQCILFGDQPWDIESGQRCGVKGYLLPSPK